MLAAARRVRADDFVLNTWAVAAAVVALAAYRGWAQAMPAVVSPTPRGDAMNHPMMKRLLVAGVLGAAAFAVSAEPPVQSEADARAQAQLEAEAEVQKDADRTCMRYTGTHIQTRAMGEKGKDCVVAHGRVYSRDDLERTGELDIADALRRLDTSIY